MFVAAAAVLAAALLWIWPPAGWVAVAAAGACAYFFRDPERIPPDGGETVVSPADGRVVSIRRAEPPAELVLAGPGWLRIGIFLSVFDVHVTRVPFGGTVQRVRYRAGKHRSALSKDAGGVNERNAVHIGGTGGRNLAVVQIAGMVARRIVCSVREGDEVAAGARMGIIRFGSRVDLYLPDTVELRVKIGQTMIGGETVLAELPTGPPRPAGRKRA